MQGRPTKSDGLFSGRCTLEGTQVYHSFTFDYLLSNCNKWWGSKSTLKINLIESGKPSLMRLLLFYGGSRLREQLYTLARDQQF